MKYETLNEQTYKKHIIRVVVDEYGQQFATIPTLHPGIGYASIADAKREIDGKSRKWSHVIL